MKTSLAERLLTLVLAGVCLMHGTLHLYGGSIFDLLDVMMGGALFGQWWMMAINQAVYDRNNRTKEVIS